MNEKNQLMINDSLITQNENLKIAKLNSDINKLNKTIDNKEIEIRLIQKKSSDNKKNYSIEKSELQKNIVSLKDKIKNINLKNLLNVGKSNNRIQDLMQKN